MGTEWGPDDSARAEALYALHGYPRLFFDFLMGHPGELVNADQITAYFAQHGPKGSDVNRLSLAGSLTWINRRCRDYGWSVPYHHLPGANGAPGNYEMTPTVARLFHNARIQIDPSYNRTVHRTDWNSAEVKATVADYLEMVADESSGRHYSKAAHRRKLHQQLNAARTNSAIEYKYQNISAAMLALGLPYIRGYKPRSNYQAALESEIQCRLEADPQLLRTLKAGTDDGTPPSGHLQRTPAPAPSAITGSSLGKGSSKGLHMDYGVLHEENRRRGAQGEKLVADYERAWPRQHGRYDLASRVEWTARDNGDGLGYDVISYDLSGLERYIEVKTTALGAEAPFYITSAELGFAQRNIDRYSLYRVYNVLCKPRFFSLEGDITNLLVLTPATYSARLAATIGQWSASEATAKPCDD